MKRTAPRHFFLQKFRKILPNIKSTNDSGEFRYNLVFKQLMSLVSLIEIASIQPQNVPALVLVLFDLGLYSGQTAVAAPRLLILLLKKN